MNEEHETCGTCNGTGRVLAAGGSGYSAVQCPDCGGSGQVRK